VNGWDDPRMPTIAGLRRRGFTPEAIRDFCDRIGVAKANSTVDYGLLEHCVRDDLNKRARRVMAVQRPLKLVIENYPQGQTEMVEVVNNPEDPSAGKRQVPFSGVVYIEHEDFQENPQKGFYRLSPGKEVRLKGAYYVTCQSVAKDTDGNITEVRCTYDPASRGGLTADGRKVKGTSHWVSAAHAVKTEVRLYDQLFTVPSPGADENVDWHTELNPKSLEVLKECWVEPSLANAVAGTHYQFERIGYYCVDKDSKPGAPVFNRIVGLRDSWAKEQKKQQS